MAHRHDTDVVFSADDGVQLVGTFTSPDGPGPHPAALLLAGSGPVDRDSNVKRLPLGVTRLLAEAFVEAGVATLRFDKRGVGASDGDHLAATFTDARTDAQAALTHLRGLATVDPDRLLVVGHSEGALHAAAIAAEVPSLAGAVLLACPARNGEETLRWQGARVLETLPAPVRTLLRLLRQEPARVQERLFARVRATDQDVMRIQGVRTNIGWLRGFLDHDPARTLAAAEVPVLALTGGRDVQVDPDDLEVIADLLRHPDSRTALVEDVNHILRRTDDERISAYRRQVRAGQGLDERVVGEVVGFATSLVGRD